MPSSAEPAAPARRSALKSGVAAAAAGGLGLIAWKTGGVTRLLTPAQATAARVPFAVLTPDEAATLSALGETLMPGAARVGVAHFVDHQLGQPPADSLLMLRYLDVPPPYAAFYKAALAAPVSGGARRCGRCHRRHARWPRAPTGSAGSDRTTVAAAQRTRKAMGGMRAHGHARSRTDSVARYPEIGRDEAACVTLGFARWRFCSAAPP